MGLLAHVGPHSLGKAPILDHPAPLAHPLDVVFPVGHLGRVSQEVGESIHPVRLRPVALPFLERSGSHPRLNGRSLLAQFRLAVQDLVAHPEIVGRPRHRDAVLGLMHRVDGISLLLQKIHHPEADGLHFGREELLQFHHRLGVVAHGLQFLRLVGLAHREPKLQGVPLADLSQAPALALRGKPLEGDHLPPRLLGVAELLELLPRLGQLIPVGLAQALGQRPGIGPVEDLLRQPLGDFHPAGAHPLPRADPAVLQLLGLVQELADQVAPDASRFPRHPDDLRDLGKEQVLRPVLLVLAVHLRPNAGIQDLVEEPPRLLLVLGILDDAGQPVVIRAQKLQKPLVKDGGRLARPRLLAAPRRPRNRRTRLHALRSPHQLEPTGHPAHALRLALHQRLDPPLPTDGILLVKLLVGLAHPAQTRPLAQQYPLPDRLAGALIPDRLAILIPDRLKLPFVLPLVEQVEGPLSCVQLPDFPLKLLALEVPALLPELLLQFRRLEGGLIRCHRLRLQGLLGEGMARHPDVAPPRLVVALLAQRTLEKLARLLLVVLQQPPGQRPVQLGDAPHQFGLAPLLRPELRQSAETPHRRADVRGKGLLDRPQRGQVRQQVEPDRIVAARAQALPVSPVLEALPHPLDAPHHALRILGLAQVRPQLPLDRLYQRVRLADQREG